MGRPQKMRRICEEPRYLSFAPRDSLAGECCILSVDEYETIRWIDYKKMTQEQCAKIMDVSRPTVTEIYESARYKLADSILNGKELQIGGGCYQLCNGQAGRFCQMRCKKETFEIQLKMQR